MLKALGYRTGFTHMEWFLKPDGEAVFGEIGARPPGARSVDLMNYASDIDLFTGWAEAVALGSSRRTSSALQLGDDLQAGPGARQIQRIEGLGRLAHRFGSAIVAVGPAARGRAPARLEADAAVRRLGLRAPPDLARTMEIADRVGIDLQLYAS